MQRLIPVLAVALALQLALALGLGLRANPLAAQKPETPLVQADLSDADRLLVEGPAPAESGETAQVELVKKDGIWTLPGYFDAPASTSKVQSLLDRVTKARRGFPIATTRDALKRFKVATDSYERHLTVSKAGQTLASVYLGSSPGLRKSNARTAEDEAVYAVELAAYEMPDRASDWLDPDLLKRDADKLVALEITWPDGGSLRLARQEVEADQPGPAWTAEELPVGESLDPTRAEALVQAVAGLRVDGVLGTEAKPEWQQDRPVLSLSLKDKDGHTQTWTLSKVKDGESHVVKASERPWYLELKEWSARPLLDAAARDKLVVPDKIAVSAAGAPAGAGAAEPSAETGPEAPAASEPAAEPSASPAEKGVEPAALSATEASGQPGESTPEPASAVPAEAEPPVSAAPEGQAAPGTEPAPKAPAE